MKKVIYAGILGVILSGFVTCICFIRKKKKDRNKLEIANYKTKDQTMICDEGYNKSIIIQDGILYDNDKHTIFDTISSRHYEALTIVKDSVDNIKKQINISDDTNTEIDEITGDLDKMLSED